MSGIKLQSPHRFRERILLFGGGGAGKTSAVLSMLDAAPGNGYVIDSDYSAAYERAMDTDYPDLADRVHVTNVTPDWDEFITVVEATVANDDKNMADSWLVIDPVSPSWDYVQNWYVELVTGGNIGKFMAELKKASNDTKEYAAAVAENMNWQAIKKEYARFYRAIQSWHGHLVLTAEAKSIKGERDNDLLALYGPVGYRPVGEGRLHHVTSTTLFMKKGVRGWQVSTLKDRNRAELENEQVDEIDEGGFASTYLKPVGGWTRISRKTAES